jgi:hypothetical protein
VPSTSAPGASLRRRAGHHQGRPYLSTNGLGGCGSTEMAADPEQAGGAIGLPGHIAGLESMASAADS